MSRMERTDFVAGLSIAGLILPEAIAYAGIAGLPAQHAILAALAGTTAYFLLGRSRFAIISPTSSSAAILAAALGATPLAAAGRSIAATLIVGLVGITFGLVALGRLSGLANFISRPVLRGFAFGLALTIIVKQLPMVVGLKLHDKDIGELLRDLVLSVHQWHYPSMVTAFFALAALLLLRLAPNMPAAFAVLAGGIVTSISFDLPGQGVATVGVIDFTLHWPEVWLPNWSEFSRISQLSAPIVLILFAESWGTMRALALRHGDEIDPNREMAALGLSNIMSALVRGMPVGAGFSASSAAEAAGALTRWAGLFAAMTLGMLVLFAMPLVAHLPTPVLAAVVISALLHAVDFVPLIRLWRIRRDLVVAISATFGVLLLGVLNGMLFAIILSVGLLIRRLATPSLTQLGQLGNSHDYVDITRHHGAWVPQGMIIVRPAEPLFFANAEPVLSRIAALQASQTGCCCLVLSLEESFDIDSTALDALTEFSDLMRRRGVRLQFARVRDNVRDLMQVSGATDLIARSSYSVDDAVQMLRSREA